MSGTSRGGLLAVLGPAGTVRAMMKHGVSSRPAARVAADIGSALAQAGLADHFPDVLAPLRAHSTLAAGYLNPAGRAQVQALLDVIARHCSDPAVRALTRELRSNLRSGARPLGLVNLLGSPLTVSIVTNACDVA